MLWAGLPGGRRKAPSGQLPYALEEIDYTLSHTQLPKADLLTFWFSSVGPFLVMAPKG